MKTMKKLNHKKTVYLSFLAVAIFSSIAYALPPTNEYSNTETETRAYAGLVWSLNNHSNIKPDLIVGIRSLRVNSNHNVNGANLGARIKLQDGISFDSVRLNYVDGQRDIQGNIGAGYSFANSSLLGNLSISGQYLNLGSDFLINTKTFNPYVDINTLSKPDKVNAKSVFIPFTPQC